MIGGSGSGKSEYAERLVCSLEGKRIYIATMIPWDEECLARIARHRSARALRGFHTIERYMNLGGLQISRDSNVLLECLGNLTANELYEEAGKGIPSVLEGIHRLSQCCLNLTIVTNEVFSGGTEYEGDTLRYLHALAEVNCKTAALADRVIEMTAGCPNFLKGKDK